MPNPISETKCNHAEHKGECVYIGSVQEKIDEYHRLQELLEENNALSDQPENVEQYTERRDKFFKHMNNKKKKLNKL
jgi:hypothetical protein